MEFRQCSINGTKYMEQDDNLWIATDRSASKFQPVEEYTVIFNHQKSD